MTEEQIGERLRDLENRVEALEALLQREPSVVAPAKSNSVPLETVDRSRSVVEMALNGKKFVPGQYGDDRIDMDFTLTLAASSRPTRAVKGQLVFTDLFGDTGFIIGYTVNDALQPGAAFAARGVGFDYNQFMNDHNWMLGTDIQDMMSYFEVRSIIYQDGTSESF
jgi:hypothetical protein